MSMDINPPKKVLFVCLGNICRSPAAEGILLHLLSQQGLNDRISVDSAGTSGYHRGQLPDSRMRKAAEQRGYELNCRARSLVPKDIQDFDLIIAMDRDNYRAVHQLASTAAPHVKLLSDYLGSDWPRDVPDPYHGGEEGFEYVLNMLEAACPKILAELLKG